MMPQPVIRKIQKTNKGQWTLTLPATFVLAMDLSVHDDVEIYLEFCTGEPVLIIKRKKR